MPQFTPPLDEVKLSRAFELLGAVRSAATLADVAEKQESDLVRFIDEAFLDITHQITGLKNLGFTVQHQRDVVARRLKLKSAGQLISSAERLLKQFVEYARDLRPDAQGELYSSSPELPAEIYRQTLTKLLKDYALYCKANKWNGAYKLAAKAYQKWNEWLSTVNDG